MKRIVICTLLVLAANSAFASDIAQLRALAENGYAPAQYNLGIIYDTGEGVPQNHAEAVKWYRIAAQQGDMLARRNLASIRY